MGVGAHDGHKNVGAVPQSFCALDNRLCQLQLSSSFTLFSTSVNMMYYNYVTSQKVFQLVQHDMSNLMNVCLCKFYFNIILISAISTKIVICQ